MSTASVVEKTKIVTLSELSAELDSFREQGKRIVQCHGVFDLLHPGHLNYFRAAKREGDILVVTITGDRYASKAPGRPVFKERVRAEFVAALECVDFVALNDHPSAVVAIGLLKPDVYVKGSEYADMEADITGGILIEKNAVEGVGGRLHFTAEPTHSSTKLLNDHFDVFPEGVRDYLESLKSKYAADDIIRSIDGLKNIRAMVIGESIVDEYHYVRGLGKTSKDNLVATGFVSGETFAGGVLAAANHAAGFCGKVEVVTCLGRQDGKESLIRERMKANVSQRFFWREDAPTIVKRRYVDQNFLNKLFEVYFHNEAPLPTETETEILAYLDEALPQFDVVIITDYGHGFFTPKIIEKLNASGKFLALNTQTNAGNWGYNLVTKYPRADYVCIDEPETRLALSKKVEPVEGLIEEIAGRLKAGRVMVTRGHKGSMGWQDGTLTETPTLSGKIVDRTGAGDAFLAVSAPCAAAGMPMELVGFIGNIAGGVAVSIVGNRSSVEYIPLCKYVRTLLK
jgi:rfaE bifunctional protein nucleotidyltransferase chain/domain